jgi:four helix bundle protein
MAYSSMIEVLSQLLISYELGYVSKPKLVEVRQEIEKVTNKLNALRNSLNL